MKKNQRIDLEYEKPQVKFIEQFRMRVNGGSNKDVTDYKIEDKIQKKIKTKDDEDPVIVNNSDEEDIHDIENAQVVESNGNDGNLDFNFQKFKPEYVGSKKQKNENEQQKKIHSIIDQQEKLENAKKQTIIQKQPTGKPQLPPKKSKIDEIIKKTNKPTILSFEQDDY